MMIISHLNAKTPEGISWLEEVVITGLRRGDGDVDLAIKSYGGGGDDEDEEEEGEGDFEEDGEEEEGADDIEEEEEENTEENRIEDDDAEEQPRPHYGPAVYVIRKNGPPNDKAVVMKEGTNADAELKTRL